MYFAVSIHTFLCRHGGLTYEASAESSLRTRNAAVMHFLALRSSHRPISFSSAGQAHNAAQFRSGRRAFWLLLVCVLAAVVGCNNDDPVKPNSDIASVEAELRRR